MSGPDALPSLDLAHALMGEAEARDFLGSRRITRGDRTMDPKAQLVGEFVRSIRVPGYFPPLPELRRQLHVMVQLLDEPAPALRRVEDVRVPGPAGPIVARVYDPAPGAPAPRPVLAYFHGGGWVQGDLDTHHGLCARIAHHSGVMVVAFDYRLAPEHKFPAAVEDCLAAYRWLRTAGSAPTAAGAGLPVPACQVLIYPALDFEADTPSHHELAEAYILPRERILWYREQYLREEADRRDPRASPLRAPDLRGQPPTLIVTAGFDPLRDEGQAYAERLRAAGVDVVSREYPGQIHAFVSLTRAIPEGLACTREVADYVRRQLARSRAVPGP